MRSVGTQLLLMIFAFTAMPLHGQRLGRYLAEDSRDWIKELADKLAHDGGAKSGLVFTDEERKAIRAMVEANRVEAENRERIGLNQLSENEKKHESDLTNDIKSCVQNIFVMQPLKRATKAAGRAALAEYRNQFHTEESVYQAAYQGFSQKLSGEKLAWENDPKDKITAAINCVVGKRVHDPIQVALLRCGVTEAIQGKTCFTNTLEQFIGKF